jgi:hypothetical protein
VSYTISKRGNEEREKAEKKRMTGNDLITKVYPSEVIPD